MKHLSAIAIKFVMILLITWVVLGMMTDLVFSQILAISLLIMGISYAVDMFTVQRMNDIASTAIDAAIALVVIFLFNYWSNFPYIDFIDALVCAVVIGVGEFLYHKFIIRKVVKDVHYQT